MFENIKNMTSMLSQAKQFQEKLQAVQAELSRKTVEADAGAGAVQVTVNGNLEVVRVRFDPAMLVALVGQAHEADQQMVQDLVASATNAALAKAKDMIQTEFSRVAGGLNLPGLGGLLSKP